jgi:polyisoprenoid-binding protein YceI
MKVLGLLLSVAIAFSPATYATETFKIDPTHSTIGFRVRHMLGSAKGNFSKFSGTIVVDREHPEQSSVSVKIAASSIDTGIAKRDEHLRAGLFEVAKYPEITFKSRQVKQTSANGGQILGDLTMHGVTHQITLEVSNTGRRWRVRTAPVRRSEFGLVFNKSAETVSMIADEVTVDIEIQAE